MFFGCFKKFPKPVCSLTDSLRGYGVGFLPCGFWGMISGQADGHVYRLLFACGVCVLKRVWRSKDNLLVPSQDPCLLSSFQPAFYFVVLGMKSGPCWALCHWATVPPFLNDLLIEVFCLRQGLAVAQAVIFSAHTYTYCSCDESFSWTPDSRLSVTLPDSHRP